MSVELRLKSELLEGAQPFALDFGGSVIKLAYHCKDPEDENYTLIKCRAFPRADLHEALDFIKSELDLVQNPGELPKLLMTGVGIHEYSTTIEETLKFKPVSVWEAFCNSRAMRCLLTHVGDDDALFYAPLFPRDASWQEYADDVATFMTAAGNVMTSDDVPHVPRTWPVLLVTLGSAFVFKLCHEDGREVDVHFTSIGGRTFLGVGSLLTGAKTYEELVSLAEKGDDRTVNTYTSQLRDTYQKKEGGDALYENNMDVCVFSFGWAPGKNISDFKKEDLALACLYLLVQNVTEDIMQVCCWKKVNNVIINGGFASGELTRRLIEKEIYEKQAALSVLEPQSAAVDATCRTLVAGPYLGAIGVLLQSTTSQTTEQQQPEQDKPTTS